MRLFGVHRASLVLVLSGCAGSLASAPPPATAEGDARWAAFMADVERHAEATSCDPLPVSQWTSDPLLQIHEATTCRYRITWLGWSPPRDYDYVPDAEGFIVDYFIESAHGWVFWNLRAGEVIVRPVDGQPPLDEDAAQRVASWARATNFPGLDPARVVLVPSPCVASPCTPHGS